MERLGVHPICLVSGRKKQYIPAKFISDKGKPAERLGRKGAGPRQTDLGGEGVWDGKADPHKTAALPKRTLVVRLCS